jgi:purine-nucleoside phosphorylase
MTPQERYVAAMHAMQSGVAADMETDPNERSQGATTPKHLRVGVNGALADQAALAKLLIAKGIITEAEYLEAVADAAEAEKARYEQLLSERFGKPVTLG